MERQKILETLRHHERELKAAGILHLRLFGSVARNDAHFGSDVDLLADFDASTRITLVKLGHLQAQLSDLLGTQVDLSSSALLKDAVRLRALHEAVLAF
jgi:uncharacterized protein